MSYPDPFYKWRPHPWHGIDIGPNPPKVVNAYIEITPFDTVKYEIDKTTGFLRCDRPQRSSSQSPALYGFIPRTFCGPRVCELMAGTERGDNDPLDICVLTERPINRSEVLLNSRIIGGLPMNDGGEADDKIIAVLENDPYFEGVNDISELPSITLERLRHYFTTYKLRPGEESNVSIAKEYGREYALKVVEASIEDYKAEYGD